MVRKTLKDQGFGDFKKATALFEYSTRTLVIC